MIAALPHQATKTRFLDNEVRAGIGGEQFGISADWLLRGRMLRYSAAFYFLVVIQTSLLLLDQLRVSYVFQLIVKVVFNLATIGNYAR